jgi:hypothetical protein
MLRFYELLTAPRREKSKSAALAQLRPNSPDNFVALIRADATVLPLMKENGANPFI